MRRVVFPVALLAVAAVTMTVAAYQQPPAAANVIEVDKVRDNLYVLKGGGGNTTVFIGASGVVVIDTKLPGWGQPLLAKIRTLTSKPITTIINTHTHYDHVSGNVDFPASVEVIAQENTARYMNEANPVYGLQTGPQPNIFNDNNGRGLPRRTFKEKLTLGEGADEIDLRYFGRAHTGGDAFVIFPALRVMHVADTFPTKDLPIMDRNNGGSGIAFLDTLMKATAVSDIDTIINGHNATTTTPAELREYAAFIREFVTFVQDGKKSGKSADEVAASWKTPAKYVGYGQMPIRLKADVQVIFDETK